LHLHKAAAATVQPAAAAAATAAAAAEAAPVGLQQDVVGGASAGRHATESVSDDNAQLAVETAMLLLQLQPTCTPLMLSKWIEQHLHAYNDTSYD
jgi:hypothetical protein